MLTDVDGLSVPPLSCIYTGRHISRKRKLGYRGLPFLSQSLSLSALLYYPFLPLSCPLLTFVPLPFEVGNLTSSAVIFASGDRGGAVE